MQTALKPNTTRNQEAPLAGSTEALDRVQTFFILGYILSFAVIAVRLFAPEAAIPDAYAQDDGSLPSMIAVVVSIGALFVATRA